MIIDQAQWEPNEGKKLKAVFSCVLFKIKIKVGRWKMEEDNIYEYDDNNWPNKDLRTAAKGKERKGKER